MTTWRAQCCCLEKLLFSRVNSTPGSIALFIILLSLSCAQDSNPVEEVKTPLKHIVLLDLKQSCTPEEEELVLSRLSTLDQIEGVYHLSVSRRTETEDPRALQDYDVMLSMEFESIEKLMAYAVDEHHLAIRKSLASYVASAPRVIDSMEDLIEN